MSVLAIVVFTVLGAGAVGLIAFDIYKWGFTFFIQVGSFKPLRLHSYIICDVLRDLVPFVQFKNVKNTQGGVLLLVKLQPSACNFTTSNTPPWCFSPFLNCTNGTKSSNASHIYNKISCMFIIISIKRETGVHSEPSQTIFAQNSFLDNCPS